MGSTLMSGPGPLGNLRTFVSDYGDVVFWRVLGSPTYLLVHPDDVESVLVTHHRSFSKGRATLANPEVFGNGLLTSDDSLWLKQRRLSQPAFHRSRIAFYAEAMAREAGKLLERWTDGQVLDVHSEMMQATLAIAAITLFGVNVGPAMTTIAASLNAIIQQNSGYRFWQQVFKIPSLSRWRYLQAVENLNRVVYGMIRERRRDGGSEDLMSDLLRAQDDDGSSMTPQQLRDELMTMLLAGHETTAVALSWTWFLLAENREVEVRVHEEVDRVLGGRIPNADDASRLVYINQVIRESMRLYPPAWLVTRRAKESVAAGGYEIPEGSHVLLSPWATHRDGRFFEDPERFWPERWSNKRSQTLPKFAYFPFGGGPRICIGAGFALMEAAVLLAAIAQRFRLVLVRNQVVEPLPSITLRPKYGIKMQLVERG